MNTGIDNRNDKAEGKPSAAWLFSFLIDHPLGHYGTPLSGLIACQNYPSIDKFQVLQPSKLF